MSTEKNLGEKIKALRQERGWSQAQLAIKSGVSRSHISLIELRRLLDPRADVLLKLAKAFNIPVEELYEAAGYDIGVKKRRHVETAEELLERARLASPVSIPVYGKFHAGAVHEEPIEYVYWARTRGASKNVEAYRVYGRCMEPQISPGDVVIVDRDLLCEPGKIILCLVNDELAIGRLVEMGNEIWLTNKDEYVQLNECKVSAVVIEVIKRLG